MSYKNLLTLPLLLLLANTINAATGTWKSTTLTKNITYTTTEATTPAKDFSGKLMTIVYLENLACEKIGQNSNADDVAWLLAQGYRVIELDYARDAKATTPYINSDIIAINAALNKGTFCGCSNISTDRAYILFEGYRLQRDVSYYKDDPTVYNYPDAYAKTEGDSLFMDIAYPANPSRAVPTVLSFSYSNSYAGTASDGYVKKYQHKRMYLGYTFAMFSDSFLEGCPAAGCAWAIADHPKYCDWGRGNRPGGTQKEYGAVEVCPDAARKVRSAIRTVRGFGAGVGLGHDVAMYGFSRGSTAASLAIGDAPFDDWLPTDRGRYPDEDATVQAALLGPGVFDYSKMNTASNEYKHMTVYATYAAQQGAYTSADAAWAEQGGANAVATAKTAPCFLFYNSDDDANYDTQARNLMAIFDAKGITYELLKDYGTGHAVPQKTEELQRMYTFLNAHVSAGATAIVTPRLSGSDAADMASAATPSTTPLFSLTGQRLASSAHATIVIANGRKYIR